MEIDGHSLTIDAVLKIAKSPDIKVSISPESLKRVRASRKVIEEALQNNQIVYGVTTGFGANAEKTIPVHEVRLLQRFLILSHSAGVGEPVSPEISRATMLIRLNSLAKGYSGVRPEVLFTLAEMLNKGVAPVIPSMGSVGASGDLAPLSHMALTFTKDPRPDLQKREEELVQKMVRGENLTESELQKALQLGGEVFIYEQGNWRRVLGILGMHIAGIPRIVLEAKEGLALNNGTAFTSAVSIFAIDLARKVFDAALLSAALSFEAITGFESAFYEDVMELRNHRGQVEVAKKFRKLIEGSSLVSTIKKVQQSVNIRREFGHVQDAYSLRCIPQVYGPVLETLEISARWLTEEINGVTDNPVIIPDAPYYNKAFSAGNFHAEYPGFAMDFLRIAFTEIGNITERRIFRLLDKRLNRGLPAFLAKEPGLMNGLMLAQYTAASLTSMNKLLAHPATVDNVPTSANREDHVSMAPNAMFKTLEVLENVARIVAIEFLTAYRGIKFRKGKPGRITGRVMKFLDEILSDSLEDRVLSYDIEKIFRMIKIGKFQEFLS